MGIRVAFDQYIVQKVGDVGDFAEKIVAIEKNGRLVQRDRQSLEAAQELGSAASHRAHAPAPEERSYLVDILESGLHRETLGSKAKSRSSEIK